MEKSIDCKIRFLEDASKYDNPDDIKFIYAKKMNGNTSGWSVYIFNKRI